MKVLLASLAAGAVALPSPVEVPAAATAPDLTIRSVTLNPASPVVGPVGAVRLVVEVVALWGRGPGRGDDPGRAGCAARGVPGRDLPRLRVRFRLHIGPGPGPRTEADSRARPGLRDAAGRHSPAGGWTGVLSPGIGRHRIPGVDGYPVTSGHGPDGAGPVTSGHGPDGARLIAPGHGGVAIETARVSSRAGEDPETWRFVPDKSLSRWYPAGRWTVTATARERAARRSPGTRRSG